MQKGFDYTAVGVVYFCHDGAGNVLFNKRGVNCRDEQGTWDIGGGALEHHDAVEDTLRKEIKEEYGTDVLEYEFLGYRDIHKETNGKKTHWVILDFKVLVDKNKAKNGEPHKFDAVEWFTLSNLPSPLYPQLPGFLEK
ncbi:NUDIX domain-containing protein, partial [Candidatus Nomurabacteria bacterium]|nr:NUDIX domain-containing protein [Candidatus Nomurabacteria bacterium]